MKLQDTFAGHYHRLQRFVPARLLYHPDHFRVRALLGAPAEDQHAIVARRLRAILSHAVRHVPYYKRRMRLDAATLANESPHALLERFPLLDKATVMANQRDFLDERADPARLLYATSGGSTGQGIGMWRSKRLADIEKAFFAHEWGKLGFRFERSRTLRIGADAGRPAHEAPLRRVGNRLMLSPYHISPRHKSAILGAVNRFRPEFIHAYPSSAAALAELAVPRDLDRPVRAVLLASEPASEQQLAAIARMFNCPISINYGLSERTNLAFADASGGHCGPYRFHPLYGLTENHETGRRAEIIGTSLWNELMPLIRYRTGDVGAVDATGNCSRIEGRDHDFLVDRHGNHIPGLAIVIDEATWDFVRLFQVRQFRPGAITLALVGRHGALSAQQKHCVLSAQLRRWGGFFDIQLEEEVDIPLAANGKRKLVLKELYC
jgi:phenylacetate-CoA ligase